VAEHTVRQSAVKADRIERCWRFLGRAARAATALRSTIRAHGIVPRWMSVVPDMFELCIAGSYQRRLRRSTYRIDAAAGLSA